SVHGAGIDFRRHAVHVDVAVHGVDRDLDAARHEHVELDAHVVVAHAPVVAVAAHAVSVLVARRVVAPQRAHHHVAAVRVGGEPHHGRIATLVVLGGGHFDIVAIRRTDRDGAVQVLHTDPAARGNLAGPVEVVAGLCLLSGGGQRDECYECKRSDFHFLC